MAELLTSDEFRELFNVDSGVPVDLYVTSALSYVRRQVAPAYYEGARAEPPADVDIRNDLKLAAVYFAIYLAYPVVNNRITQDGVVTTARDEGNTVLTYLRPKEIKEGALYFKDRAYEAVSAYLATPAAALDDDYPRSISGRSRGVLK